MVYLIAPALSILIQLSKFHAAFQDFFAKLYLTPPQSPQARDRFISTIMSHPVEVHKFLTVYEIFLFYIVKFNQNFRSKSPLKEFS